MLRYRSEFLEFGKGFYFLVTCIPNIHNGKRTIIYTNKEFLLLNDIVNGSALCLHFKLICS